MTEQLPKIFFHSISQQRLRDSVNHTSLPGLSRSHIDPEGKVPGIWITDNLKFANDGKYGTEQSDEIIDTWDAEFMRKMTGKQDATELVIKKSIAPIILEIHYLEEERIEEQGFLPHQFFYSGNLDWSKIKAFLVVENDSVTENVARQLNDELKQRGFSVDIKRYQPLDLQNDEQKEEKNINELK